MASNDTRGNIEPSKRSSKESMTNSMQAIGELRKTSRMRNQARADIRELERAIEDDRSELTHRVEVANNYDAIVAEQTQQIRRATAAEQKAIEQIAQERQRLEQLKDELSTMKEQHEQKLRPYRNLMESSRGRSDDAAKLLANARRDVRRAEADLNEATKRRTQRIATAHRTVDNSKERLASIQDELDRMQADPAAKPEATQKLQDEYAAQQRQLERANNEVTQVTAEAQNEVDQAQQYLWKKQRELTTCEQNADSAKQEATAHKDEYDRLFRSAQDKERRKQDEIRGVEQHIDDLEADRDEAVDQRHTAEEILEDAHDINAHPEVTESLRERISDGHRDLKEAKSEFAQLTSSEKELRKKTLSARIIVIVAAVVAVLLVALIIWFMLPK